MRQNISNTFILFGFSVLVSTHIFANYKIQGQVVDADSNGVANTEVRLPGLDAQTTDAQGYFEFQVTDERAKQYFPTGVPGVDLYIEVKSAKMVMLEPANETIRLARNPNVQETHFIRMVPRGSLLLLRSEKLLDVVFTKRLNAAVEAKEKEAARAIEIATQAERLGLNKDALRNAVDQYKESLRTSSDLQKRGLAALDDANSSDNAANRQQNIDAAKTNFRESIRKDEAAIAEGLAAQERMADTWFYQGNAYFSEARYDSARYYYSKADSAVPGKAERLNWLGRSLHELAKHDLALLAFQNSLALTEIAHGRNHHQVAISLNNIGVVLHSKGDYAGAMEKYNEALVIDVATFGRNHLNVATALNNIGEVFRAKGDNAGALANYNEALIIAESIYGRNHSNVARVLNNIALALEAKGDNAGALEKYNEALVIAESIYGRNHPNVATYLNNIAGVLHSRGDYTGALANYNEALSIDESTYGRKHPKVTNRLNNIGEVLRAKGDYAGALANYNEALSIDESYYGRDHPNVATYLNNIAGVLRAKGDYAGALEKYNEALVIAESIYGKNHPKVATRLNNIGEVFRAKGDYPGALEKYNEALEILESVLGLDHPNAVIVRNNRNQAYWESLSEKERWRLRTGSNLKKLNDQATTSSSEDSLSLLNQIGLGYIKQQKADSAHIFLSEAFALASRLKHSKMKGVILNNQGAAYKLQQDWLNAGSLLKQSVRHNTATAGENAAVLAYSYFHLSTVMQAGAKPDSVSYFLKLARDVAEKNELAELLEDIEEAEQNSAELNSK